MSRHPAGCSAAGGSSILGADRSSVGRGVSQHGMPRQLNAAETSSVRDKLVMSWDKSAGPRVRSSLRVHV